MALLVKVLEQQQLQEKYLLGKLEVTKKPTSASSVTTAKTNGKLTLLDLKHKTSLEMTNRKYQTEEMQRESLHLPAPMGKDTTSCAMVDIGVSGL